jgi:RND superfamily putative drug exporter
MRTLAGWCVRHRRLVLIIWAIVLILSLGMVKSVGSAYSNSFSFPNTESTDAIKLLQASAPKVSGDTEQIVFATSGGYKVTDPSVEAHHRKMISKIEALPHVAPVTSPYSAAAANDINADKTVAFISVTLSQQFSQLTQPEAKRFVNTAMSAATPTSKLRCRSAGRAGRQASFGGTGLGVILALVVLLLIFGSIFAASSRSSRRCSPWARPSGSSVCSATC